MFKILKDNFIRSPGLDMELDLDGKTDDIELFGNKYRMYSDEWKHHVHIKCTNRCDANCAFCIETPSRNDKEDADSLMESMRLLVFQMKGQGMFRTMSVTGGEPTMFNRLQDIVDFAHDVNPTLFSINSNGARMNMMREGSIHGWMNLSKHNITDNIVFSRSLSVTRSDMEEFKMRQPHAKLRIQCVLGVEHGLENIDQILGFIKHYYDVADDFSFRSLIVESEHGKMSPLFMEFREMLFDGGFIREQAIQDYYVYETYDMNGIAITLSWANMFLLQKYNETNQGNFLEEIIVHPDGMVTGSWNRKTLIIKEGGK